MRHLLQGLAALVLAAVFAAPVAAATPGGAADVTVTGILETALVELGDGRDHRVTTIRTADNVITRVEFERGDASHITGARVSLTGRRSGGVLRVSSASAGGGAVRVRRAASVSASTDTVEASAVAKTVAVVMFNFTDLRTTPFTRTQVTDALTGSPTSVKRFFEEESKGRMTLTGTVFGWYPLDVASTGCDWGTWHTLAWSAANAAGANLESYTNVAFVFPNTSACRWAGLGYVPGSYTYLNGNIDVQVMTHELGHNFGISHANAGVCTSNGARVMIAAKTACTTAGYADPFSTMGNNALRHNHGSHLGELGWLEAGEKVVGTPGNSYTITPYFGAAGVKLVRIPRGDGSFFDLDVRTPYGAFDTYAAGSPATVGVTVRIGVGTASPTTSPQGTLLLDSTPGTADLRDAPLAIGRTMTDPVSAISITPVSVDGAGVVVQVSELPAPPTPGSVTDAVAPTAPERVTGDPTTTTVALSWTPATDDTGVVGYRVTRNGTLVANLAGQTWKDTARAPSTTYLYTVAALDGVGNVSTAATVAVRTLPDTTRPSAPRGFRKIARSGAYVTFDWSPSTDNVKVAKYHVYRVGRSRPVAVTRYSKIRIWTARGASYYVRAVDTSGNVSGMSARARGRS